MTGKWNIKIKGLPINNVKYPVAVICFDLDSPVQQYDILDFGNGQDFGYLVQINIQNSGIANNYNFLARTIYKITPQSPSFVAKTVIDNNTGITIKQEYTTDGNVYRTPMSITMNNYQDYLSTTYLTIQPSNPYNVSYSPLLVFFDENSKKVIVHRDQQKGCAFLSTDIEDLIKNVEGFSTVNSIDVVSDNYSTNVQITIRNLIDDVFVDIMPPDSDPYIANTKHAGGDGENQNTDEMQDETLPSISAADTGFVTLYKPSISQMNALANYMWGTLDIDSFKKVIANPMDVILGLSILPGIVPSGGSSTVKVGNIDTGVSMTKVGNQYVKFNCGSVTIKRKWGAFLDYSPFTKAFIYLPFIGIEPIDVDEIMNKTVSVTYNIDVLSGGCCAFVKVEGTTLYSYIGQCACSVPVTGKDWSTMINGVLGAVSSVAGTIGSIASGNVAGAISGIAAVAQNVVGAKPSFQRSGTMGGMGGMMGIKTPYIIIERAVQAVPGYQNKIIGYPSFITRLIGDFKGYTEIEQCHLENIPCTGDEMIEIENILKTGVIL